MSENPPLLEMRDLEKHFQQSANLVDDLKNVLRRTDSSAVKAVDGVNLSLERNQVHGIIGESGCGKSTLLLTLMGVHEPTRGELLYKGTPVTEFTKAERKEFQQNVQIIFQDPFNSLNPKFTVRQVLREPLKIHGKSYDEDVFRETLARVNLNPPEQYLDRRESQLSGGEKQRVAIARALMLEPEVILADEPVSMLDVSTQTAVLDLLNELTDDFDVSVIYVSHDLSTVSYICDRVNVMYLGRLIESAPTDQILRDPKHPYTQALINAIPVPDPRHGRERTQLQGSPSDPANLPQGCRFKDRCPERMDVCDQTPEFRELDDAAAHQVACHLYTEQGEGTAPSTDGEPIGNGGEVTGGEQ